MSIITTRNITRNQLTADRDTTKLFVKDNRFISVTFRNNTGAELILKGGELVGRATSGENLIGKALFLDAAAENGSAIPLGIAASGLTLANNAEATIGVCIKGEIDKAKLILKAGTTLTSLVGADDQYVSDLLDRSGIFLVESTQNTEFDN